VNKPSYLISERKLPPVVSADESFAHWNPNHPVSSSREVVQALPRISYRLLPKLSKLHGPSEPNQPVLGLRSSHYPAHLLLLNAFVPLVIPVSSQNHEWTDPTWSGRATKAKRKAPAHLDGYHVQPTFRPQYSIPMSHH